MEVNELLFRLKDKTEELISHQGAAYFMSGGDLLAIINDVMSDVNNNVSIRKWSVVKSYEQLKGLSLKEYKFQHFTSNNMMWNRHLNSNSYDSSTDDQIRLGYIRYRERIK